jgi:hypothetical protein
MQDASVFYNTFRKCTVHVSVLPFILQNLVVLRQLQECYEDGGAFYHQASNNFYSLLLDDIDFKFFVIHNLSRKFYCYRSFEQNLPKIYREMLIT